MEPADDTAGRRLTMFLRFVTAAVRFRRRRLLLAFSALAVAATLATALFSVYSDIERKMRVEFRGYGSEYRDRPGRRCAHGSLGACNGPTVRRDCCALPVHCRQLCSVSRWWWPVSISAARRR